MGSLGHCASCVAQDADLGRQLASGNSRCPELEHSWDPQLQQQVEASYPTSGTEEIINPV